MKRRKHKLLDVDPHKSLAIVRVRLNVDNYPYNLTRLKVRVGGVAGLKSFVVILSRGELKIGSIRENQMKLHTF